MEARFSNSFAGLPERFFAHQAPARVAAPALITFNDALATELGLELGNADLAALFSGNTLPDGATPIAMAYAGHQFGNFVPRLGDGRAILLGEVIDQAGMRRDIQLKGAGRTIFSRGGDGRAALGPVLREYLVSEAMHALGIPTTRALAAVMTGESILRERLLPGAVLTRVLASNIRVGTFQYFAARGDVDGIRTLADYAIARHYPDEADGYLGFLNAVARRQAGLIASWMAVGFIHGVMNTDNMAISGETIDYGPCAFMDGYNPATVFSSIDQFGRYAYANQPRIAQWNLARLAETLLPLLDPDEGRSIELANEVIHGFSDAYEQAWLAAMRRKLGLRTAEAGDGALIDELLGLMAGNNVDFTSFFRRLTDGGEIGPEFGPWVEAWRARGPGAELMRRANPVFIPRNHLVEAVIAAAMERRDFGPFQELLEVLRNPYDAQPGFERYAEPPEESETVYKTYCGT